MEGTNCRALDEAKVDIMIKYMKDHARRIIKGNIVMRPHKFK